LTDTTVKEAQHLMSRTALELRMQSPDAAPEDWVVVQTPDAGTSVRRGSLVLVTTKSAPLNNSDSAQPAPGKKGKPAMVT
jgi:beta-lactam-binding protein with PASTA domain